MDCKKILVDFENLLIDIMGKRTCSIGSLHSHYEVHLKVERINELYSKLQEHLSASRPKVEDKCILTKIIEQRKKNVIKQMKELREHLNHLNKWQEDTNLELEHAELKEEMMSNHPELFV